MTVAHGYTGLEYLEETGLLLVALNSPSLSECHRFASNVVQYSLKANNLDLNKQRRNRAPCLNTFFILLIYS